MGTKTIVVVPSSLFLHVDVNKESPYMGTKTALTYTDYFYRRSGEQRIPIHGDENNRVPCFNTHDFLL